MSECNVWSHNYAVNVVNELGPEPIGPWGVYCNDNLLRSSYDYTEAQDYLIAASAKCVDNGEHTIARVMARPVWEFPY